MARGRSTLDREGGARERLLAAAAMVGVVHQDQRRLGQHAGLAADPVEQRAEVQDVVAGLRLEDPEGGKDREFLTGGAGCADGETAGGETVVILKGDMIFAYEGMLFDIEERLGPEFAGKVIGRAVAR